MHEEVGVTDVDMDVSPLDAMRPAGSTSWWTRMQDVQCFPLMQCQSDDVEATVDDGLVEDEVFAKEHAEDDQVVFDHDVPHIDDGLFWCVHWWCSTMTLQGLLMISWWSLSVDALDEVSVGQMKGPDEPLCLDVDVKVADQVDVRYEDDSDESLLLDNDVNFEDSCHEDVADSNAAAV